jgi:imidazolonepropionase-like amidohydrolase
MKKVVLITATSLVLFALVFGLIGEFRAADDRNSIPPITELDFERFRARMAASPRPYRGDAVSPELTPTATPLPAEVLVIAHGTIIDGTGRNPVPNGVVVMRGDRIVAVGRPADIIIPARAKVIDVAGKTIMPGIINAHVHHACDPLNRRHYLVDGVSAVCDLGCSLYALPNFERDVTRQNEPAARGFRAGPILTAPDGYPSNYGGLNWHYEVATPAQAEAAVNFLLDQHVDVIKLALEPGQPHRPWPVLSSEQVRIIVQTAHARGVLVRAHVRQANLLDIALAADVDVIEHVPLPFCLEAEYRQMLAADALHLARQPGLKAQLARMVAQEVVMVPTLEVTMNALNDLPGLEPAAQQAIAGFVLEIVHHFRAAGGVIALGNDLGQSSMPLTEMELLQAAGLTPMEIIEAGTRHAAYVSGHGDQLGSLEPGKLADIIIVDGDPLLDIRALDQIILVIKGGEIAFRTAPL